MIKFNLGFLLILLLVISGCKDEGSKAVSNEGIIIYDVTFPYAQNDPLVNIYPSEMTLEFKKDKVRIELNSFGNFISLKFILDNEKKEFNQLLKALQDYYSMKLNEQEVNSMIATLPNFQFKSSEEKKVISGYECESTNAFLSGGDSPDITLYHTSEIDIDAPNWCTQFSAIEDVLLGYELEQFGLRMKLEAREIRFEPISDDRFEIPEKYEQVTFEEMEGKLEGLINNFN